MSSINSDHSFCLCVYEYALYQIGSFPIANPHLLLIASRSFCDTLERWFLSLFFSFVRCNNNINYYLDNWIVLDLLAWREFLHMKFSYKLARRDEKLKPFSSVLCSITISSNQQDVRTRDHNYKLWVFTLSVIISSSNVLLGEFCGAGITVCGNARQWQRLYRF